MWDYTWSRQKNWGPHAPDTNHRCMPTVGWIRLGDRLCLCQESALKRAEENNQSLLWEEGKSPHTGEPRELSSFPKPMGVWQVEMLFLQEAGKEKEGKRERGREGDRGRERERDPFCSLNHYL